MTDHLHESSIVVRTLRESDGGRSLSPAWVPSPFLLTPEITEAQDVPGVSTLKQNAALSLRLRRVAIRSDRPPPVPVDEQVEADFEEPTHRMRPAGLGPSVVEVPLLVLPVVEIDQSRADDAAVASPEAQVAQTVKPGRGRRRRSRTKRTALLAAAVVLSGLAGYVTVTTMHAMRTARTTGAVGATALGR